MQNFLGDTRAIIRKLLNTTQSYWSSSQLENKKSVSLEQYIFNEWYTREVDVLNRLTGNHILVNNKRFSSTRSNNSSTHQTCIEHELQKQWNINLNLKTIRDMIDDRHEAAHILSNEK
ncbi:hypothetical protein I4U23_007367 [Adineta vaga]|nr:hypothetical protein I4U23_007367 [Adineta vaga]